MSKKPQIGFIGVGYMGHGMAKNILQNGYPLMVKGNRNRTPVDSLVGMGAVEATSVAQMARDCDIIHICLSNSPQVEAIIRGPDGIIANGKAGLIVIDATTADPTSTEALAAEMAAAGMTLVDAPLGRTPKEAEEGTLDAMVGTDPDTFATILPVIECWAGNINHIGPVGSAHKMKLIMNFIAMGYSCLYSEAVTLGAKVGIAPQKINKVIGSSRLSNGFFDTFMKYTVGRDRDAHKFTIANASKDVRYVANMATAAGMANPMGAAMRNTYAQAEAVGKGDHYVPMLSDHIAELNGVDLAQVVKDNA
ncbi:MAG: NAD(P)-dependent oxidoreductase [Rhodobacteraceae bacterium]|jgi:3-hydroxyisobutyrate dehydrogenase-like beta-hydroxyacid dehydrogenase|nr:NAD(P)-dependent oxidoreductase [Paracoccaceae bacterium]